jgi:hypothetical protein
MFHVAIPMLVSTNWMSAKPATSPTQWESIRIPLTILVVDDHALNRMLASATIRKHFPDC